MLIAARRTSAAGSELIRYHQRCGEELAEFVRRVSRGGRAVDETNASELRAYRLRARQPGSLRLTPSGIVVTHGLEAMSARAWAEAANTTSYAGYFKITAPNGVDPSDYYSICRRFELRPPAEWIKSPWLWEERVDTGRAVLRGHPPIRIAMHGNAERFTAHIRKEPQRLVFGLPLPDDAYREELVDADVLVGLLGQNEYLQDALKKNPQADLWLTSCETNGERARVIAEGIGRRTHYSTGETVTFITPRSDHTYDVANRFALTDEAQLEFVKSMESLPKDLRLVGEKFGWSGTGVFVKADSKLPAIATLTPR
jgi:hypothetical protein